MPFAHVTSTVEATNLEGTTSSYVGVEISVGELKQAAHSVADNLIVPCGMCNRGGLTMSNVQTHAPAGEADALPAFACRGHHFALY
eukprot:6470577-Amphidinium_carterae.1